MAKSVYVERKVGGARQFKPPAGGRIAVERSPSWVTITEIGPGDTWVRRSSYPSWEIRELSEYY